jgi:hypothetical protein
MAVSRRRAGQMPGSGRTRPKPVFCAMPTQPDHTSAAAGRPGPAAARTARPGPSGCLRRPGLRRPAQRAGPQTDPPSGRGWDSPVSAASAAAAEVALHPGQGGVTDPVGTDLLRPHPRQLPADPSPQVVVPAGPDRPPVGVPQQLPAGRGMALLTVPHEAGHQGGGDRLPAHRLALLPQQDQALVRVQIGRAQGQRAATAARGLGVQPQQQRVSGQLAESALAS